MATGCISTCPYRARRRGSFGIGLATSRKRRLLGGWIGSRLARRAQRRRTSARSWQTATTSPPYAGSSGRNARRRAQRRSGCCRRLAQTRGPTREVDRGLPARGQGEPRQSFVVAWHAAGCRNHDGDSCQAHSQGRGQRPRHGDEGAAAPALDHGLRGRARVDPNQSDPGGTPRQALCAAHPPRGRYRSRGRGCNTARGRCRRDQPRRASRPPAGGIHCAAHR